MYSITVTMMTNRDSQINSSTLLRTFTQTTNSKRVHDFSYNKLNDLAAFRPDFHWKYRKFPKKCFDTNVLESSFYYSNNQGIKFIKEPWNLRTKATNWNKNIINVSRKFQYTKKQHEKENLKKEKRGEQNKSELSSYIVVFVTKVSYIFVSIYVFHTYLYIRMNLYC